MGLDRAIDITVGQRKTVLALLERHLPNTVAWVYGSRAEWTSRPQSDLDLVVFATPEQNGRVSDLREAFEESDLPFRVDLFVWDAVPEQFRKRIKRDYVVMQLRAGSEEVDVPSERREVALGEIAELVMGQSPPGSTYNDVGDGLPFFQGVKDFNYRRPTPRVFCSAPARIAQPGDILFSVRAPIGRVNVADRECATGRGLAIIRPRVLSDARYLEFILRHLESNWDALESGGSVFGNATKRDLEFLPLSWPSDDSERSAIAHILGTLDDKIELNRRMNETLEAMARALFKSWFADFDPVRAKMEGRDPGLPKHLADLFPDRMVDSELGETPEGWEVRSLDSIATFLNGLALQKYPVNGGSSLPVIKIAQLRAGHTLGADLASSDLPLQYVVHDGDLLFSWSGSLELDTWTGGDGALNQHLFKVTSAKYPKWLYYHWVQEHLPGFREIAADKVTTMGHIQRHHLGEAATVIPNASMLEAMNRYMQPLLERGLSLRVESRTLAALRDTLLPKLISGDLRVKGTEAFLERVL